VAIDVHRRPYYGERKHAPGVTGAQSENGTNWFWSYATAVSLLPGSRHTLALTTVGPEDTLTDVIQRLLAQVNWSGIEVRYVLLDRAFCAVGVMNALVERNMRFIIPVVRRARAARFFEGGYRGWHEHTFRARRKSEGTATVRVAVVPDTGRASVFACSDGWQTPAQVALVYGRRFGIESSYRQLGECLAVTTSWDRVYRLLLVGVSLLIRAWWVRGDRPTLNELRWELIVLFTTTTDDTPMTQTETPQRHAAEAT
jgi:putative transposase